VYAVFERHLPKRITLKRSAGQRLTLTSSESILFQALAGDAWLKLPRGHGFAIQTQEYSLNTVSTPLVLAHSAMVPERLTKRSMSSSFTFRVRIREQLCLLILLVSILALVVLGVSTGVQSHRYIKGSRADTLQVTANLKADQLAQDIALFRDAVQSLTTRDLLQGYLRQFHAGNTTQELRSNLAVSVNDVSRTPLLTLSD
jgi:hypothetical protein